MSAAPMPWLIESPSTTQIGPASESAIEFASRHARANGSACARTRGMPGTTQSPRRRSTRCRVTQPTYGKPTVRVDVEPNPPEASRSDGPGDDLDEVAAGVVEDRGRHWSIVDRILRERDPERLQPLGFGLHVVDGELRPRDPVGGQGLL